MLLWFTESPSIMKCLIRAGDIVSSSAKAAFDKIFLSANTVVSWIEDMGSDLGMQLHDIREDFVHIA